MTAPVDAGRFFDSEAARYDAAHDRDDHALNALRIRMAIALELLGPSPGTVLDCGMGPGRLLAELEQGGWSVAGIDVSSEMVALARSRLPHDAARLLEAPVESLPFSGESFDAVIATGVFEYVENLPRALSEVARVLRQDGCFVVSMPNTQALGTLWRHGVVYRVTRAIKARLPFGRDVPLPRPGLVSRRRLEALLDDAGFRVERLEYIVLVPRPLRVLAPSLAVRVAKRLESVGQNVGAVLGSQYVVATRRSAAARR